MRASGTRRDRGSMLVLVVFVGVAVTVAAAAALVPVLGALVERQEARTAADAAALAGVTTTNGGALVGWSDDGIHVIVEVRVGDQVARARATDRP